MTTARPFRLVLNERAERRPFGEGDSKVLAPQGFAQAYEEIRSWRGYARTPLISLAGLARDLGVASIHYKDEGSRFGLGSFKALGGAYAVYRLLAREVSGRTDKPISSRDLASGLHRDITKDIVVTTATDGNHGRSVAWGANMFGCRAIVYIHATVSEGRKSEIARYGAEVRRIAGNYDDSVHQAARDASVNNWFVVSDTSYEGYVETPRDVMYGYGVMVEEALAQLPSHATPTYVFLQAGVGALAASVIARIWSETGAKRPTFVIVEPEAAACVFESLKLGKPTVISGDLDTAMAGLAAGEISLLAWQILKDAADAAMIVGDDAAFSMMRQLASGKGDLPLVAGESAVAGLAGLASATADASVRVKLGLGPTSKILVFGTEGDTDPELYAKIVGRTGDEVRRGVAP